MNAGITSKLGSEPWSVSYVEQVGAERRRNATRQKGFFRLVEMRRSTCG